jgi:hypothetical protein
MTTPMNTIVGTLDPGIAPVVHMLRGAGFDTTSSCEGHADAEWGRWGRAADPYVTIEPGEYPTERAVSLLAWLRVHKLSNCWVDISWIAYDWEPDSAPVIAVTWYSREGLQHALREAGLL